MLGETNSDAETSCKPNCSQRSKWNDDGDKIAKIPTRLPTKMTPSKPVANPLQFVKVAPCNLYQSTGVAAGVFPINSNASTASNIMTVANNQKSEQRKEQVIASAQVNEDAADWQSNLDNWKCNRRKQQEHIIERVVEVKKLELEEHDRNKKPTKTFNEMMEERGSKGKKVSVVLYNDEGGDDWSDLGLTSPTPQNNDDDHMNANDKQSGNTELESDNANEEGKEEFTYEKAIQSYLNFPDKTGSSSEAPALSPKPPVVEDRRRSSLKIEAKLNELEKLKNVSAVCSQTKPPIPKINIGKRLEIFEKVGDEKNVRAKKEQEIKKSQIPSSKSIKERLSDLKKLAEPEMKVESKFQEVRLEEKTSVDHEDCRSPSPDGYHYHRRLHRSMDDLDSVGTLCTMERSSSLEFLDYPASVLSGDADSGIHTTDVSSSVSQADDFDHSTDNSSDLDVKVAEFASKPVVIMKKVEEKASQSENQAEDKRTGSQKGTKLEESGEMKGGTLEKMKPMMEEEADHVFSLLEPSLAEPPNEKPPPLPVLPPESEDEDAKDKSYLRRMDSTKRIKKEIRQKRSSFLGIESVVDDTYLEPELELVKPPPDMTSFLREERRLEKLLYRQSICSESDSTLGESRDSGVELERGGRNYETSWNTIHSRQNSEPYANTGSSEEDELLKKDREILEMLQIEELRRLEDRNRYVKNAKSQQLHLEAALELGEQTGIGKNLELCLKKLEEEKCRLEREKEKEQMKPQCHSYDLIGNGAKMTFSKHKETVPGNRQGMTHHSLHDMSKDVFSEGYSPRFYPHELKTIERGEDGDYRCSMPNLQPDRCALSSGGRNLRMAVPLENGLQGRAKSKILKPTPIKGLKVNQQPRVHNGGVGMVNEGRSAGGMSKQTLQALSAVPKSRIMSTDSWVNSSNPLAAATTGPRKKANKSDVYQHWLIQEAEQRRITEHHQKIGIVSDRILQEIPPSHSVKQQNSDNSSCSGNKSKSTNSRVQMVTEVTKTARKQGFEATTMEESNVALYNSQQEKMLSISGKKKCSRCGDELGRGAAMIIESLRLFYHIDCFKCCVCCVQLGDGLMGTDVRVRNNKLHCQNCYSNEDGVKFSCV